MNLDHSDESWGFSLALITPAIVSTIKQAEREAAPQLHALADFYISTKITGNPVGLSVADKEGLSRFGVIMAQQFTNGAFFLTAVRAAVLVGGVGGGILAQAAVTLNTMFHPGQTQRFNPSKILGRMVGHESNWLAALSTEHQVRLALIVGGAAAKLGYGTPNDGTVSNDVVVA